MGLIRKLLIVPLLAGGFYVAGCKGDAKTKVETPKSQEAAGQWHGNRQAAISLTYDDGMATQFQHTFSALRRYNLKATFYLSVGTGETPDQHEALSEAAAYGHELGNHTIFHPCLGAATFPDRTWVAPERDLNTYTVERLTDELTVANRLIAAIDGKSRRSFAYPCNDRKVGQGEDYVSALSDLFPSARTVSSGVVTRSELAANPYMIPSFGVNEHSGADLIAYVDSIIAKGGYGTITFHGIGGDWLSVSKEAHETLLAYLDDNRDVIWVDTVLAISDYARIAEQDD